jgi:hypothetical protein
MLTERPRPARAFFQIANVDCFHVYAVLIQLFVPLQEKRCFLKVGR